MSFDLSNSGGCGFHNRRQVAVTRAVYLNKRLTDAIPNPPLFRPLPDCSTHTKSSTSAVNQAHFFAGLVLTPR